MPNFLITAPDGAKYNVTGPEGSTESEALARLQQQLSGGAAPLTMGGTAKAAGRGLIDAATGTLGLPGDVGSMVSSGVSKLGSLAGIDPETVNSSKDMFTSVAKHIPIASALAIGPTSHDLQKDVEGVTGPLYDPQNKTEEYTRSIASMVPAIAMGPGGIVRRAIEQVVFPGIASQAAGDIPGVKGSVAEPYVRAAAAVAAPIATGRLITPLTTAPTRAAAVKNLRKEGVDVSAGQSTGSKFLRKAEGELGGSTAQALAERQGEQFTAAVMRRVGEDAPRATTEVIDQAFTRIGGNMNKLAANNVVTSDTKLVNDLNKAENEYNRLVAPNARVPGVRQTLDDIDSQFQNKGVMAGDVYQSLRSQLGADARSVGNDPRLKQTLYEIQHVLDDAMERSIQKNNPADVGAWKEARIQYRNLLTVERAINSAGEAATSGLITPQNLARSVKQVQGQRDYSRGRSDLAVLARNGSEVMAPLANSETASRLRMHTMLSVPSALIGGTAAHGLGAAYGLGTEGLLAGTLSGAVVPRAIGEGLIRARRYLGNTALPDRQTLGANIARGTIGRTDRTLQ